MSFVSLWNGLGCKHNPDCGGDIDENTVADMDTEEILFCMVWADDITLLAEAEDDLRNSTTTSWGPWPNTTCS